MSGKGLHSYESIDLLERKLQKVERLLAQQSNNPKEKKKLQKKKAEYMTALQEMREQEEVPDWIKKDPRGMHEKFSRRYDQVSAQLEEMVERAPGGYDEVCRDVAFQKMAEQQQQYEDALLQIEDYLQKTGDHSISDLGGLAVGGPEEDDRGFDTSKNISFATIGTTVSNSSTPKHSKEVLEKKLQKVESLILSMANNTGSKKYMQYQKKRVEYMEALQHYQEEKSFQASGSIATLELSKSSLATSSPVRSPSRPPPAAAAMEKATNSVQADKEDKLLLQKKLAKVDRLLAECKSPKQIKSYQKKRLEYVDRLGALLEQEAVEKEIQHSTITTQSPGTDIQHPNAVEEEEEEKEEETPNEPTAKSPPSAVAAKKAVVTSAKPAGHSDTKDEKYSLEVLQKKLQKVEKLLSQKQKGTKEYKKLEKKKAEYLSHLEAMQETANTDDSAHSSQSENHEESHEQLNFTTDIIDSADVDKPMATSADQRDTTAEQILVDSKENLQQEQEIILPDNVDDETDTNSEESDHRERQDDSSDDLDQQEEETPEPPSHRPIESSGSLEAMEARIASFKEKVADIVVSGVDNSDSDDEETSSSEEMPDPNLYPVKKPVPTTRQPDDDSESESDTDNEDSENRSVEPPPAPPNQESNIESDSDEGLRMDVAQTRSPDRPEATVKVPEDVSYHPEVASVSTEGPDENSRKNKAEEESSSGSSSSSESADESDDSSSSSSTSESLASSSDSSSESSSSSSESSYEEESIIEEIITSDGEVWEEEILDDDDAPHDSFEGPLVAKFRARLSQEEQEADTTKRLLRELANGERLQKKIEKQMVHNGISVPEIIPYDEAKQRIAVVQTQMQELQQQALSGVDVEKEFMKLEEELARYSTAMMMTDEWAAEQQMIEFQWEAAQETANQAALEKLRSYMPVDVRNLSENALTTMETPNGKKLPAEFAKRLKRVNILQLIRVSPSSLERMHPSLLEGLRTTGMTLTERRAIYQHLKYTADTWESMSADKSHEKKWMWHEALKRKLKEVIAAYEKDVNEFGPPGSHGDCGKIGMQCPVKANSVFEYDGDYGFPTGDVYEEVEESTMSPVAKRESVLAQRKFARSKKSTSKMTGVEIQERVLDRLDIDSEVLSRSDEQILEEIAHTERRAKTLEKQLVLAGVKLADDSISYDLAKRKIAELTEELKKIGKAMGSATSNKQVARLEGEYEKYSDELDKYQSALVLTDEWIKEQKEIERAWEETNAADNLEALKKIRRHMPVNVRTMTISELTLKKGPHKKRLPELMVRKWKRTTILMMIRVDPQVIEKMHPSNLDSLSTSGLTLTERRALHEHLRDVGATWKMQRGGDPLIEKKFLWFDSLRSKFKELLEAYTKHVEEYGPPGEHLGGCRLIGNQCPLKADLQTDYSSDYGYPDGPEYEEVEVEKHNLLTPEEYRRRVREGYYD